MLENITNSSRKVSDVLIIYETAVTDVILRYGSEDFSWALRWRERIAFSTITELLCCIEQALGARTLSWCYYLNTCYWITVRSCSLRNASDVKESRVRAAWDSDNCALKPYFSSFAVSNPWRQNLHDNTVISIYLNWRKWLKNYAANRKGTVSILDEVIQFFN